MSHDIVLATINARYYHASLGLRYLYANLGALQARAVIEEFTLDIRPRDIAERILAHHPRIVGLGVYIWNVELTGELAALIKTIDPECIVVMGGPETGCESDLPHAAEQADYIISGQADIAFRDLCRQLLENQAPSRYVSANVPALGDLEFPYAFYNDEDIRNRLIYVEASRGCPFKCEFCLSSLDRTAWNFDLDVFLGELSKLYARGVRHFKFVDRTFNLKLSSTTRILDYFLDLDDPELFLHFELIPDRLPDALKHYLVRFSPGSLQFEIGIQTFNPKVQDHISRCQDNEKSRDNLVWIRQNTHAHIHADLIFGLPGEDLQSFGDGFNRLYALRPHEIQVGILKRLRGTPMVRHEDDFELRFNPAPPYDILSTDRLDFVTTQRMQRFARYWDMVANSGRFSQTMTLFDTKRIFEQFLAVSDWLFDTTGKTHRIALPRLFELLYRALSHVLEKDSGEVGRALAEDFDSGQFKGTPDFLNAMETPAKERSAGHSMRQARHGAAR